ncbi:Dyp-type peroxidase domain-containing protein [Saccharothrix australiensis]|uniref:Dyp-type peroxidase family protein n=1 Tax=Saccharothrix australiensis TaxID=2072 RepID=A0A495W198_9PSEU|nr:Dyp-type peroxidase domain-containing protein [Saccharothrix australiensis]RKT54777.1 Dyp-type peroxidase family protein [Saccharothrix australiensis]
MRPDPEPTLAGHEIQGDIVPGFRKPHLTVLALDITDAAAARRWCAAIAPRITTLAQAVAAAGPGRVAAEPGAVGGVDARVVGHGGAVDAGDAWSSVAFSRRALHELLGEARGDLDAFTDLAFQLGMAARSASLGDPTDGPGHPDDWVVRDPDVLLVLAADVPATLAALVASTTSLARRHGLAVVYREDGHRLDAAGSGHFGFPDGAGQPDVRGLPGVVAGAPRTARDRWSGAGRPEARQPERWQAERWQAERWQAERWQAERWRPERRQAERGQSERWRYEARRFGARQPEAGRPGTRWPEARQAGTRWSGSSGRHPAWPGEFVFGYPGEGSVPWRAGPVRRPGPAWSVNGSYLVFRRLRQDVPAFRRFMAGGALHPVRGGTGSRLAGHVGRWPGSVPAPHAADAVPAAIEPPHPLPPHEIPAHEIPAHRRVLRRGLPYGPTYEQEPTADRGLLFLSYQTSIVEQFEFLHRRRARGHDPADHGHGRHGGRGAVLTAAQDFAGPTGGGYFFAPSISALRTVLGDDPAGRGRGPATR